MSTILTYILARLREASTWRGLVLLATAVGAHLTNAQVDAIVQFGLAVAGLIGVVLPDGDQPA